MNPKRIVIDGKTHNSVEEMPEDIRKRYEAIMRKVDKDQDGMPDMPINRCEPPAHRRDSECKKYRQCIVEMEGCDNRHSWIQQ